jgi:hypothetical protein
MPATVQKSAVFLSGGVQRGVPGDWARGEGTIYIYINSLFVCIYVYMGIYVYINSLFFLFFIRISYFSLLAPLALLALLVIGRPPEKQLTLLLFFF